MTGFAARRRLIGATLALLLQALFIALLLVSLRPAPAPEKSPPELTYVLPRLPRLIEPPPRRPARPAPGNNFIEAPLPNAPAANPEPPTPAPPDLRDLGQALSGCAPEIWSSLTPQQRALCPRPDEDVAVQNVPKLLDTPLAMKNAAFWTKLADRNTQFQNPCTHLETHDLGAGLQTHIVMVDLTCAADHGK